MKLVFLAASVFGILSISANPTTDVEWQGWKSKHNMKFTPENELKRYAVFSENRKFVLKHNQRAAKGLETYTVEINQFAAMNQEEFSKLYLTKGKDISIVKEYQCEEPFISDGSTPADSISYKVGNPDVRVTSVKDQGSCGSCWSFSASMAIEAVLCENGLKDCNTWTGLSPQQMVDCGSYNAALNPNDNHGCGGGWPSNAGRYVAQFEGGQNNFDDYPYISGHTKTEQACAYDASTANLGVSSGCTSSNTGDETMLKNIVSQKGPASICIDASGAGFQMYSGGVYSSRSCTTTYLNHAVGLTGYGNLNGVDYWEVKNSWAETWGDKGYILIARNQNNMCGVATDAIISVL